MNRISGEVMEARKIRSVSHKGEKVCSYTVDFKLEVVQYAEQSSIHAAGRKYNVSRSSVRDWKKKKVQLADLRDSSSSGAHRRRLSGGGRKVFDSSTEKNLIDWIAERKRLGLTISGALIIKKAKSLQQEKLLMNQQGGSEVKREGTGNGTLTYSRGWLEKFMNRNGLVLKNVPTYRSPVENAQISRMDSSDALVPSVIPLEDMLPDDDASDEPIDVITPEVKTEPENAIHDRRESRSLLHQTISKIEESRQLSRQLHPPASRHVDRHTHELERRKSPITNYRQVHTMVVVPPHETLCCSTANYPLKKTADDMYMRTTPTPSYQKTRVCNIYPCTTDSTVFYKSHGRDTYPYASAKPMYYKSRVDAACAHRTSYLKVREDNTKVYYTAPHSPPHRHKTRLSENLHLTPYTIPNTTVQYGRAHDLYTYSSPASTSYHRTRTGESYIYEKSRDMQNPIVIPLDDILPNDYTNNKVNKLT